MGLGLGLDNLHSDSMASVKKDLMNVRVQNLHQFGDLQENVEEVYIKLFSEEERQFKRKCQLLCFTRAIIAIEFEEHYTSKKIVKKYFKHFRMQGFKQKIKAPEKNERGKWIVVLKSWGDGPDVDKDNSFYVKFSKPNEKKANQFRDKIEEIRIKAHRKIEPSEEHRGHRFHRYVYEISKNFTNGNGHKKCGHCGDFLLGRLLKGIECDTCRSIYHEECFKSSNSDAAEEDADTADIPDVEMVIVTHERQFLSQEMSRQEAKEELREKEPGSFLVRYSQKESLYVLSRKTQTKVDHETIKQREINGVTYYWLTTGQGKTTILDVIKKHQIDRELYFPISNRRPSLSMVNDPDIEDDEDGEDYTEPSSSRQSISRDCEEDIPENVPWGDYFHGDMDRQAAKSLLKENLHFFKQT